MGTGRWSHWLYRQRRGYCGGLRGAPKLSLISAEIGAQHAVTEQVRQRSSQSLFRQSSTNR